MCVLGQIQIGTAFGCREDEGVHVMAAAMTFSQGAKVAVAALAAVLALLFSTPSQANGRSPCDRGAGGISHCMGGKFVCNNGTISRSKKVCQGSTGAAGKKARRVGRGKGR